MWSVLVLLVTSEGLLSSVPLRSHHGGRVKRLSHRYVATKEDKRQVSSWAAPDFLRRNEPTEVPKSSPDFFQKVFLQNDDSDKRSVVREEEPSEIAVPGFDPKVAQTLLGVGLLILAALFANQFTDEWSPVSSAFRFVQNVDFGALLADVSQRVEAMGPAGIVYFAAVYVAAEVLALPAVPLTASAGYLFGAVQGTAVVLVAATIAAGISFLVGRFLLRGWVESIASESEEFRAIDNAVQREGFKIVLLLRLSPIFPFALSNYLYGLTAVDFWPYLAATLLGFAPGTALYVYGGEVANIVQSSGGDGSAPFPWYAFIFFHKFSLLSQVCLRWLPRRGDRSRRESDRHRIRRTKGVRGRLRRPIVC